MTDVDIGHPICAIPGCLSRQSNQERLLPFPTNKIWCKRWIAIILGVRPTFKYSCQSHICRRHFLQDDFFPTNQALKYMRLPRRNLKPGEDQQEEEFILEYNERHCNDAEQIPPRKKRKVYTPEKENASPSGVNQVLDKKCRIPFDRAPLSEKTNLVEDIPKTSDTPPTNDAHENAANTSTSSASSASPSEEKTKRYGVPELTEKERYSRMQWKYWKQALEKKRSKLSPTGRWRKRRSNAEVRLEESTIEIKKLKKELNKCKEMLAAGRANVKPFTTQEFRNCMYDINALKQVRKYSQLTRVQSIQLYCQLGNKKYSRLRKTHRYYPSVESIRKWINPINIQPGILDDMFTLLQDQVDLMPMNDRFVTIILDEMTITPRCTFDLNTKKFVGIPTIAPTNKVMDECGANEQPLLALANHALSIMVAGMCGRFKQIIGYHFTGTSFDGALLAQEILKCIKRLYAIGLTTKNVSVDMASANISMLKTLGVNVSK